VPFSSDRTRLAWDAGAEAWDEFVESGADYYRTEVHGPALLVACGEVGELPVLDLGCGQGWFSRQLARRGARVIGVDLSPAMLAHARRHEKEEPLGIEYVELDAAQVHRSWAPASFELVTACMSIQDMSDPKEAIEGAARLLPIGGRLVFSVPHPFSEMAYREWERDEEGNKLSLKVDRYFDSGPGTLQWDMPRLRYSWETPRWRLSLSEWSTAVRGAGLVMAGLREPRPTAEQVARRPELEDCRRLPYFLVIDGWKVGTTHNDPESRNR
jgi:SAM-dependent methyltransferase